jgi:hypothetical protein
LCTSQRKVVPSVANRKRWLCCPEVTNVATVRWTWQRQGSCTSLVLSAPSEIRPAGYTCYIFSAIISLTAVLMSAMLFTCFINNQASQACQSQYYCYTIINENHRQKLEILSSSGMLRSVNWFRADVSGLRIRPIFKGHDSSNWTSWPFKMEPIGSPETSVRNQPTLRNIPEDDRIRVNCNGSLRSRINEKLY